MTLYLGSIQDPSCTGREAAHRLAFGPMPLVCSLQSVSKPSKQILHSRPNVDIDFIFFRFEKSYAIHT